MKTTLVFPDTNANFEPAEGEEMTAEIEDLEQQNLGVKMTINEYDKPFYVFSLTQRNNEQVLYLRPQAH